MLADAIVNEIHQTKNKDKKIISNRIRDYIFLCFFLGNDFLPHFPALNIRTNGIDILLDVYKNTLSTEDETLTDGDKIVWKNLRKIIQKLGEEEENYIVYENKKRVKTENRYVPNKSTEEKMNKLDLIPSLYREDEIYINTPETGWRERYYKRLFEFNIDESREKQVSINYLEGLEWTFKYYLDTCYDWRWKYNYNYPPLLNDLYKYIPYFETEFIEKKIPQPVNSNTQLIYVLPFNNLDILEKSVYKKISHKLNSWYNNNYNFTWAYCKYFWESHIHLPEIDIDEVEKILTN
jgi:5'-3' exonuclease